MAKYNLVLMDAHLYLYLFVYEQHTQCVTFTKRSTVGLTFDVEIHGLADVGSHIVADSTQVEAAVFLQDVLDE